MKPWKYIIDITTSSNPLKEYRYVTYLSHLCFTKKKTKEIPTRLGNLVTKRIPLGFVPEGLQKMKAHNVTVTGTIQADCVKNASSKNLKKEPRRSTCGLDKVTNVALFRSIYY